MALQPGEKLELALYFDRSVVEAYANGEATAGRWYPDAPADIRPGFFAEGADAELCEANVWRMGAIWKDYAGE
jgi:hypothetical protein